RTQEKGDECTDHGRPFAKSDLIDLVWAASHDLSLHKTDPGPEDCTTYRNYKKPKEPDEKASQASLTPMAPHITHIRGWDLDRFLWYSTHCRLTKRKLRRQPQHSQ